ncbi:MAG TPA: tetratricopeptide repeat protein [Solirubrobacteraceae bacterium]|nr:tetratricopeptide repeat protein [Solirubrobacteraceae bacterium]
MDLGDIQGARAAQERALKIKEVTYGPDHPEVAKTLKNLGNTLKDLGDTQAARTATIRSHAIFVATLGEEHPLTSIAAQQLSDLDK